MSHPVPHLWVGRGEDCETKPLGVTVTQGTAAPPGLSTGKLTAPPGWHRVFAPRPRPFSAPQPWHRGLHRVQRGVLEGRAMHHTPAAGAYPTPSDTGGTETPVARCE